MLNDIISISGLFLTLATFLFNFAWPKISVVLDLDENISGDCAKKRDREKINRVLFTAVLPLLILFMLLFYVNLPTVVQIIASSTFSFWHFNPSKTLYMFVVFALFIFLLFNGYLLIKLLRKRRNYK